MCIKRHTVRWYLKLMEPFQAVTWERCIKKQNKTNWEQTGLRTDEWIWTQEKENYSKACGRVRHATGSGMKFVSIILPLPPIISEFCLGALVHLVSALCCTLFYHGLKNVNCGCDRTLNCCDLYQTIRQDALLIKADCWYQQKRGLSS